MKNEICECGHEKRSHDNNKRKCHGDSYKCPCKKFKPQNHSQSIKRVATAKNSKVADTLSDKMMRADTVIGKNKVAWERDIKEFIKKLKDAFISGNENYLLTPDEKINKLAGDKLIK